MSLRWADVAALLALTAIAFGLRVAALGEPYQGPGGHVFDEHYFADAACRDLSGQDYLDPEPPLGKLLIAAGIEVGSIWLRYRPQPAPPQGGPPCRPQPSGYGTWGWRLASLAFGTALVPLIYLLALALWPSRLFAVSAGVLLSFDGLEFVQSRLAMLDIFPVFFATLSVLLLVLHRRAQTSLAWRVTAIGLGVALGLGVATKWTALSAWALTVLVLSGGWLLGRISIRSGEWRVGGLDRAPSAGPTSSVDRLLFYVAVLVVLPMAVYILSYVRYLGVTHAIPLATLGSCDFSTVSIVAPSLDPGGWLREVFLHDRWAYAYHLCQTRIDPNGSPWFSWPFLLHPSTYYRLPPVGPGQPSLSVVWNLGNPVIWWAAIPGIIYCAITGLRARSFAPIAIAAGYACAWLPFALIPRGLYLYHMMGALPFMVLATAFLLARLAPGRVEINTGAMRVSVRGVYASLGYLALCVAAFAFFYPLWTGTPITNEEYQQRIWLDLPQLRVDWR